MTAKEFDRQFWRENDPMTTPIWKCLEAYVIYYNSEIKTKVPCILHSTDWDGKCFKCGTQIFQRT